MISALSPNPAFYQQRSSPVPPPPGNGKIHLSGRASCGSLCALLRPAHQGLPTDRTLFVGTRRVRSLAFCAGRSGPTRQARAEKTAQKTSPSGSTIPTCANHCRRPEGDVGEVTPVSREARTPLASDADSRESRNPEAHLHRKERGDAAACRSVRWKRRQGTVPPPGAS